MTSEVIDYRFRLRRGNAATWASVNDVLLVGEIGLEKDTGLFKIGDGVTAWNSLPYHVSGTVSGMDAIEDGQTIVWDATNECWLVADSVSYEEIASPIFKENGVLDLPDNPTKWLLAPLSGKFGVIPWYEIDNPEPSDGDPYWNNVVGLYRAIEGQIVDVSNFGGVFTSNNGLNIDSLEATPDGLPALKLSAGRTAVITTEELGTDDFTIEMWVKAKDLHSSWPRIWATRNAQNVAAGFHSSLYSGDGQQIASYAGGVRAGEGAAPYGVFHHIALVRESGVYRNYINGTDVTGVPQASQNDTNGVFVFGQGGVSRVDLWFSGVRITKGVARYTENFTPPTEPFPNHGI